MSRARVFEGHKQFKEEREDVVDDPKSGRPQQQKLMPTTTQNQRRHVYVQVTDQDHTHCRL